MTLSRCRLFTVFHEPSPHRVEEYRLCLSQNVRSFDEVFVFSQNYDKPDWFEGRNWIVQTHRTTFNEVMREAKSASALCDIIVIANADILIPPQSIELIKMYLLKDQVFCLAKWDIMNVGVKIWESGWSQDTWCYYANLPIDDTIGNYHFGVPGCDNRLLYELDQKGVRLANPSRDIRTYHFHSSGHRTNTNTEEFRVPSPYILIPSHKLKDDPEYQRVDNYKPARRKVKRPSRRRV